MPITSGPDYLILPDKHPFPNKTPGDSLPDLPANWRTLELWAQRLSTGGKGHAWGFNGPLIISASDTPQQARNGVLSKIRATISVAGGSDTVINLTSNGLVVATITVLAGQNTASANISVTVVDGDILVPVIVTPGANASGLSVEVDYA